MVTCPGEQGRDWKVRYHSQFYFGYMSKPHSSLFWKTLHSSHFVLLILVPICSFFGFSFYGNSYYFEIR